MRSPRERQALDVMNAMKTPVLAVVVLVSLAGAPTLRADDGAASPGESEGDRSIDRAPRPGALTPLLASYVTLQALDISSTYRTHGNGGSEANPLIRQALDSPATLIAIKAGSAALTVAVTNHLSKRHPTAAVLLMIGMNSAYATIVAHNYALHH